MYEIAGQRGGIFPSKDLAQSKLQISEEAVETLEKLAFQSKQEASAGEKDFFTFKGLNLVGIYVAEYEEQTFNSLTEDLLNLKVATMNDGLIVGAGLFPTA